MDPSEKTRAIEDAGATCRKQPNPLFIQTATPRALPPTCLVVPCYDEGNRLPVEEMGRFLADYPEFRFCLVNDASRDHSLQVMNDLQKKWPGRITILDLGENLGKGGAVRQGILGALENDSIEFVGYWDADLATPLAEAVTFLQIFAENPGFEMLCGCRLSRLGAHVHRRWWRHYPGRAFATGASLTLGIPVYDSQCGAKLLRSSLAREIFAQPFVSKWAFDVELIARVIVRRGAQAAGEVILEVPLNYWTHVGGSKLTMRHALRAFWDLVRIHRAYFGAERPGR